MAAAATCSALPLLAGATDGYFPTGYGMKSLGMGGTSLTRTDDAFGGANNPAEMVFAGNRFDLGLQWFHPLRSAGRSDAAIPTLDGYVDSGDKNFYIPEGAYNWMMRPDLSLGVTVYGNGGMNTDYPQGTFSCPTPSGFVPANMLCGQGSLGVNLEQLIVAPTAAYKIQPEHAIGIAPLLAYQRFSAQGVQMFSSLSSSPGNVSNQGDDSSVGAGLRLGYLGQLAKSFSVGASYSTKISMGKFSHYQGLFAGQGGFDIPANYGLGLSLLPNPYTTIAVDFARILYGGIASVGNPSTNQAPLGASNGPGFGWQDAKVWKFGVEFALTPTLKLRAGYNHSTDPITPRDVTFNILAPGVITSQYSVGATYDLGGGSEVTAAAMYAPGSSVTGSSLLSPLFQQQGGPANAGGTETINMSQMGLGVAYARHF
jgi:long-chain fatty acid transport protein